MEKQIIKPGWYRPVMFKILSIAACILMVAGTIIFALLDENIAPMLISTPLAVAGIVAVLYTYNLFLEKKEVTMDAHEITITAITGKTTKIKLQSITRVVRDTAKAKGITLYYLDDAGKEIAKKIRGFGEEEITITNFLCELSVPVYSKAGAPIPYMVHKREIRVMEEAEIDSEMRKAMDYFEKELRGYREAFAKKGIIIRCQSGKYPAFINKNGQFIQVLLEDENHNILEEYSFGHDIYRYRNGKLRLYNYEEMLTRAGLAKIEAALDAL